VIRFWTHLRGLWPGYGILAPLPFFAEDAWLAYSGRFRWENAAVLGLAVLLFVHGPRTQRLFVGIYPLGLVGVLYGTMKVVQDVGVSPQTVHLCDLRGYELALFGLTVGGQRITWHDWFQAHPSRVLDLACAVPYGTFIFVCIACAVWLFFRDYVAMQRFAWSFLALNVVGFATYHVYPAAPPWYYHAHGCQVDMLAHASEGPNLARVDAIIGVPYFAAMYGRASDVFGAMPSLHVAYPLLIAIESWASFGTATALRAAAVAFYLAMCFAAVYLDHHWVLDVVVGSLYCVAVSLVAHRITRRRAFPALARAAVRSAS
jgi:membrane-associated phospholipid phosphatase